MRILNKTKNTWLSEDATLADSFFSRFLGLMGKKELQKGCALVLKPCNSIHTFFMRFPIDALFLDKQNLVIASLPDMKPFGASPIYWQARGVVELPAGTISATSTAVGDSLAFE